MSRNQRRERIRGLQAGEYVNIPDLLTEVYDTDAVVDDAELLRRAATPRSERISARLLLDAIDEAAGRPNQRYSRRGRPRAGILGVPSVSQQRLDPQEHIERHPIAKEWLLSAIRRIVKRDKEVLEALKNL